MQYRNRFAICFVLLALTFTGAGLAQRPIQQETPSRPPARSNELPEYLLGPQDEITIMAVDVEEIANKPIRLSTGGDINLPMVGRIHAAGMTVQQLQAELTERLKVYVKKPDVSVSVTQFKSQPVTVIGSVRNPGVVQLEGRKSLLEVLSMVGGMGTDASLRVRITRPKESGPIPISTATVDSSGFSIAEVNYKEIVEASQPELNIQIFPYDVISVPKAKIVYAMGEVRKPGGFVLSERDSVSILQLLAMTEGTTVTAAKKDAKIIRPVPGSERVELAVNLQEILEGKKKDMMLQPEDILFVPDSYAKGTFRRTLDTVIQATTGMAIYRRY